MIIRITLVCCAFTAGCLTTFRPTVAAPHSDGELTVEIVDSASGQPIAARMHLYAGRNAGPAAGAKRAVKLNMPNSAEFGGHFYIDGKATLLLRVGPYTFELEAGPEYLPQHGQFE